jgi:hypothetical protein
LRLRAESGAERVETESGERRAGANSRERREWIVGAESRELRLRAEAESGEQERIVDFATIIKLSFINIQIQRSRSDQAAASLSTTLVCCHAALP